jgi:hypothetical protein
VRSPSRVCVSRFKAWWAADIAGLAGRVTPSRRDKSSRRREEGAEATQRLNIGRCYELQAQVEKARVQYQCALELAKQLNPPNLVRQRSSRMRREWTPTHPAPHHTTVSRSDIRLIQLLGSRFGPRRRWLLIGYFLMHFYPAPHRTRPRVAVRRSWCTSHARSATSWAPTCLRRYRPLRKAPPPASSKGPRRRGGTTRATRTRTSWRPSARPSTCTYVP